MKKIGQKAEAIEFFTRVFYDFPKDVFFAQRAMMDSGECLEDLDRLEEARIVYTKAVDLKGEMKNKAEARIERLDQKSREKKLEVEALQS